MGPVLGAGLLRSQARPAASPRCAPPRAQSWQSSGLQTRERLTLWGTPLHGGLEGADLEYMLLSVYCPQGWAHHYPPCRGGRGGHTLGL